MNWNSRASICPILSSGPGSLNKSKQGQKTAEPMHWRGRGRSDSPFVSNSMTAGSRKSPISTATPPSTSAPTTSMPPSQLEPTLSEPTTSPMAPESRWESGMAEQSGLPIRNLIPGLPHSMAPPASTTPPTSPEPSEPAERWPAPKAWLRWHASTATTGTTTSPK